MNRRITRIVCTMLVILLSAAVFISANAEEPKSVVLKMGLLAMPGISEEEDSIRNTEALRGVLGKTEQNVDVIWQDVYYENLTTGLMGLERGDVNKFFLPRVTVEYLIAQDPEKYRKYSDTERRYDWQEYFTDEELERLESFETCVMSSSFATLAGNTDLQAILNDAIAALTENGTLEKLQEEYLKYETVPDSVDLPIIEGADTYIVALTGDLPPMDYVAADGKPAGFNVALLSAISEEAGINFKIVFCDSGARAIQLTSGKSDIVFWAMTYADTDVSGVEGSVEMPEEIALSTQYFVDRMINLGLVND